MKVRWLQAWRGVCLRQYCRARPHAAVLPINLACTKVRPRGGHACRAAARLHAGPAAAAGGAPPPLTPHTHNGGAGDKETVPLYQSGFRCTARGCCDWLCAASASRGPLAMGAGRAVAACGRQMHGSGALQKWAVRRRGRAALLMPAPV